MLAPNFQIDLHADGTATVRDVPIFTLCTYGDHVFGEAQIDAFVAYALKAQSGGHVFPVHIGHVGDDPQPAGAFTVTGKRMIRFRDRVQPGIVADVLLTNPDAVRRAQRNELLWRSVEIPVKGEPRIRSLALLDRHAPHLELPVMSVGACVANATKAAQNATWTLCANEPVLAFAAASESLHALMEPTVTAEAKAVEPAPAATKKPRLRWSSVKGTLTNLDTQEALALKDGAVETEVLRFEADGVEMGPGSLLEAVRKLNGEQLAEFHRSYVSFRAEIEAGGAPVTGGPASLLKDGGSTVTTPAPATAPVTPVAAPAPAPAPATTSDDAVLTLKAEVEALKLKDRQREESEKLTRAVDAAMAKIGADRGVKREDVLKFADGHADPVAAVMKFADAMVQHVPPRTARFGDVIDHAAGADAVPEAVLKFSAQGPAVGERAMQEYRRWQKQPESLRQRIPIERWLEIHPVTGDSAMFARDAQANG